MSNYHIAFQHGAPRDWALASDTLVESVGLNKNDAAKMCRRGFGLILHPMTKETAEAGADALEQVCLFAKAFDAARIVPAPPAQAATSFAIENGKLVCHPATGDTPVVVPLSAVRIFYAGYLVPAKQKNEDQAMAELALRAASPKVADLSDLKTGLAVGGAILGGGLGTMMVAESMFKQNNAPKAVPVREPQTPEVCVDLVCAEPRVRVRFRQRKYNYQTLGARLQPAMRGNFKLILNDLVEALPHAFQVGQVRDAAGGANIEQEKYIREEADLNAEISAILTRNVLFGE